MCAERLMVDAEGSKNASAPLLRYEGETAVIGRFRLSHGHAYRVLLLRGCGAFLVRVYDPDKISSFTDMAYSNLATFMYEWRAI